MKPLPRWASILYVALPSYVVIMGGGAIINLGFCFIRLAKVKDLSLKADFSLAKPLIIHNVLLSALGGLMWYLQFFFYAWATPAFRRSMTTSVGCCI